MEALPPELASRMHIFFETLLRYCMDVLIFGDNFSLPGCVHRGKSGERYFCMYRLTQLSKRMW